MKMALLKTMRRMILSRIRLNLYKRRNELRRLFDRIVQKLASRVMLPILKKHFLNGRRVVAVFAEQKRQVKGILHGESDTRKTAFIEPEETIELNNDIFALEMKKAKKFTGFCANLPNLICICSSA